LGSSPVHNPLRPQEPAATTAAAVELEAGWAEGKIPVAPGVAGNMSVTIDAAKAAAAVGGEAPGEGKESIVGMELAAAAAAVRRVLG
jgi:hypothetical protein